MIRPFQTSWQESRRSPSAGERAGLPRRSQTNAGVRGPFAADSLAVIALPATLDHPTNGILAGTAVPAIPSVEISQPDITAPLAIMGVPFDNLTLAEALEAIARMVASRRPHY